jgi:hypothetical protein
MLDFIMGWVLGRNIHKDLSPIEDTTIAKAIEIEPLEEIPNVTRYVYIPEISGFNATLEGCYNDYEKTNLVTIVENGRIEYYLEVEVPETETKWGDQDLREFI